MHRFFSIKALLIILSTTAHAQELNCKVKIEAPQVQISNKAIFEEMTTVFESFLNNNVWTDDDFKPQERINCNLMITIKSSPATGEYEGNAQVVAARPIYGSSYETVLINFVDQDFIFTYNESQPMNFNVNSFNSNLTSLLAFYAYLIIGLDYDSFGELDGTKHYQNAQLIVTNAQTSGNKGWDQFGGRRNRFQMLDNLLNGQLELVRSFYYTYHRKGLDIMNEKQEEGQQTIFESLQMLQKANANIARTAIVLAVIDTKKKEFANIFSQGDLNMRKKAYDLLVKLAPSDKNDFEKILEN